MAKHSKKLGYLLKLIYIVFFISIILNRSVSKFKTTYGNTATAEIAKPIVNVVSQDELNITNLHNEEVEWDFSVNNYTNEEINQVALTYKIQVDRANLTDLQYKLYKIDGETRIELTLENDITIQEFELSNQETQSDNYCLEIKTTDDISQQGQKGNVNVSVIATQMN